MKYHILKQWNRTFYTAGNEPRTITMIKFETDTGYVDTVEIPVNLVTDDWIRKAVIKKIENARKVCTEVPGGKK